jgi:hypothetical protein
MSYGGYKHKIISVEDALSKIKSNDRVISALGPAEPVGMLEQLHTIADRVENAAVSTALPVHPVKWYSDPAMKGHFINHVHRWYGRSI